MSAELLVGRYRRVRTLGSGGMGEVWLAEDLELGRMVAVKRLLTSVTPEPNPELVERMTREARVVARLNHPAIVTLHDLVRVDGSPFLVMEYVEGESLAERMSREGAIAWHDAAPVVAEIAGALTAAHRAGVLHRDIKPANILLDLDGHAHLADFGIARGDDDAAITRAGELVGTVAYLAPDVARTSNAVAASDVWSLGATFFAAVEGSAPFADSGASVPTMIARLVTEDAPPPRRAGPLNELLGRMLATEVGERPTAAEVAAEIPRVLARTDAAAGMPTGPLTVESARPVTGEVSADSGPHTASMPRGPVAPPPAGRSRRPALAALAVLLLAGAGVGGALALRNGDGGAPEQGATDPPSTSDDSGGSGGPATRIGDEVALGASPGKVTLSDDGAAAYVPNTGGRSISVVDTVTGKVEDVEVGTTPGLVVLTYDQRHAYSPTDDGTVAVIDTRTLKVRQVEVTGTPSWVTITPDDAKVYVPSDEGTITIIDTVDYSTTTITPGSSRGEIQLTADGRKGLISDSASGRVVVIDTNTDDYRGIDVGGRPNTTIVDSSDPIAFTSNQAGYISVIDTDAEEVVATIETPGATPGRVSIAADGGTLLCPFGKGGVVFVVDVAAREVTDTIELEGRPGTGVVMTADGETGYVPDYGTNDIAAIDVATHDVTTLDGGEDPQFVTVSPDASTLYVTDFVNQPAAHGTMTVVGLR